MQRRTVVIVLLTTVLCIVRPTTTDASESDHQGDNLASSPHSIQKSDRLEAIKRYILERLNVSENRRFNRSASAPPPTAHHIKSPSQLHQSAPPQPFTSLPEVLKIYPRVPDRVKGRDKVGGRKRWKRLHRQLDETGGTEKRGAGRRHRSSRKRRQRKQQIKLTMTPDRGQNVPLM